MVVGFSLRCGLLWVCLWFCLLFCLFGGFVCLVEGCVGGLVVEEGLRVRFVVLFEIVIIVWFKLGSSVERESWSCYNFFS